MAPSQESERSKAEALADEGQFQEAYYVLTSMTRDLEARCLYVSVCRKLGKSRDATAELEQLLKDFPSAGRPNHLKAMDLIEKGDFEAAKGYLERAEAGYESSRVDELSELFTDWGNLYFEKQDTVNAVLCWRRALDFAANNDIAKHNLEQFDDVTFKDCLTVNEMIQRAKYPAQVLAHLLPTQNFKNPEEASAFAEEIIAIWNSTPRGDLDWRSPAAAFEEELAEAKRRTKPA